MDDDVAELIRSLCTRAGMIMEDVADVALRAGNDVTTQGYAVAALG